MAAYKTLLPEKKKRSFLALREPENRNPFSRKIMGFRKQMLFMEKNMTIEAGRTL